MIAWKAVVLSVGGAVNTDGLNCLNFSFRDF